MRGKQTTPRGQRGAADETQRSDPGVSGFNCTPIYAGAKVVGSVSGLVFYKELSGPRHMLRKPRAWAFDKQSLWDAEAAGAKWAEILDRANGKRYRAKLETIFARGFVVKRGCGAQWGMCLADWGNDAAPAQLALWGLP